MMEADLKLKHDKHWRYVNEHTGARQQFAISPIHNTVLEIVRMIAFPNFGFALAAQYWASANLSELERITSRLQHNYKRYGVGEGLDFKVVALGDNMSRLQVEDAAGDMSASSSRLFVFDYDTTLAPYGTLPIGPSLEVLNALGALASDQANLVQVISRCSKEVCSSYFDEADFLYQPLMRLFFQLR